MKKDYDGMYDPDGDLRQKSTWLIELLYTRHCVFPMDNPGHVKSTMKKVLKNVKAHQSGKVMSHAGGSACPMMIKGMVARRASTMPLPRGVALRP